ncbi:MAG: hypothetical protein KTV77_02765 [Wolbachia endosymbiont of Fragariocoptes setiger]|nr:hypothetical protein [Wolbachia endosymbiont of Fragariocoptes setiger]
MVSTTSENSNKNPLNTLLIFDFDKTLKNNLPKMSEELKIKFKKTLEFASTQAIDVVMVSEDNDSVRPIIKNTFGYTQEKANKINVTSPVVHSGKTHTFFEHSIKSVLSRNIQVEGKYLPENVILVHNEEGELQEIEDLIKRNIESFCDEKNKEFIQSLDNTKFKPQKLTFKNILKDLDELLTMMVIISNDKAKAEAKDSSSVSGNSSLSNTSNGSGNNFDCELNSSNSSTKNPSFDDNSFSSDGKSTDSLISTHKTNRYYPKFTYLITQKKNIVMPLTAAVTIVSVAAFHSICNEKSFIFLQKLYEYNDRINAFNITLAVVLAYLAVAVCWEMIQSVRIKEHKITDRNHDIVLDKVLAKIKPKSEAEIKQVIVEQSKNNKRTYFTSNKLKALVDKSLIIDGKPVIQSRFNNFLSANFNRRTLSPVLLTFLVFAPVTHYFLLAQAVSLQSSAVYNYGLIILCSISAIVLVCQFVTNTLRTEFEQPLYLYNEKNGKNEAINNKDLITFIKDKLAESSKSTNKNDTDENPVSRIIKVHVEFEKVRGEMLFINN